MKPQLIDPIAFRLDTLLSLGVSQVHDLARKANGRVTCYRLMLGRCLLAMRESKGFKKYGCSSEIHYAIAKLGMAKRAATDCRRVARSLINLPELTLAAEYGRIDWGKLREIVSKATPETEAFWLRLARDLEYKQIEWLVRKTPKGALPGDVFEETERSTSELRCKLSDQVLAMLDRARRLYSVEKNEAVTTAQVLEWALASYIANLPVDEESLEKVREEMDRDLQAQKLREIPLVAVARGVAAEMGFIAVPQAEESVEEKSRAGDLQPVSDPLGVEAETGSVAESQAEVGPDEKSRAGDLQPVSDRLGVAAETGFVDVPQPEDSHDGNSRVGGLELISDPLTTALGGVPGLGILVEEPQRASATSEDNPACSSESESETSRQGCRSQSLQQAETDESRIELIRVVQAASVGASEGLRPTNFPPIQKRLAFNPRNRHATKAQKREILRRESWCCSTPACSHRLYLELHHLIPYSQGGATLPSQIIGICSACHRHVHEGTLRILQQKDGTLVFTDAEGNSLAHQADLEIGSWLDYHIGWEGEEEDSFALRAFSGDWSVFGKT